MTQCAQKGFGAAVCFPDEAWKRRFRRRMLAWFRRNARSLPWRETRDPYHVWVSEIMLQQTQVVTVVSYFQRFLQAFPSIDALAQATEEQVLRQWEGLGYYRRGRQLHRAAQVIVADHDGRFPRDMEAIRSLPGIGRYTAGAIASISWDAREPILEANTVRLFSRLLAYDEDLVQAAAQQVLWGFAEAILPARSVGLFNQALMELGSGICTPRTPACDACPVNSLCPTNAAGLQDQIPRAKKKTIYEDICEVALVVRRGAKVLLRRCGPDERWAGLWDFPRFSVPSHDSQGPDSDLEAKAKRSTGLTIKIGRRLTQIRHGVTRYRIRLVCHEARCTGGRLSGGDLRWVPPAELEEYPLSVTGRKISRLGLDK